ncbi:MAG: UDP-glucose 4-epimerase GalE [Panacagrimonas sp.]
MTEPRVVLVTGGAGYIGSHACSALAGAGYLPVTVDSLVTGHRESVKWGPLEVGDIADRLFLDDAMRRHRPGAVMHFAAYTSVDESMSNPVKYYENNVLGTLSLLKAATANGIRRLVFSSTCATYGQPADDSKGIPETAPQFPLSPYGASKAMAERLISDCGTAYGLQYALLRYFNAAGAHPFEAIGGSHDPDTALIPVVLETAAGRRTGLSVFGADYPTADGSCVRDYVHVCDLADAHVLSLQHLEQGGPSQVFNLGNGTGFSVFEVVETARRVTGELIPFTVRDRRPGDRPSVFADATKARRVLGWSPRYPQIETILEHAWRWHRNRQY